MSKRNKVPLAQVDTNRGIPSSPHVSSAVSAALVPAPAPKAAAPPRLRTQSPDEFENDADASNPNHSDNHANGDEPSARRHSVDSGAMDVLEQIVVDTAAHKKTRTLKEYSKKQSAK